MFLFVCASALVMTMAAPRVPCGVPTVQPITSRTVGGQMAKPGSWPWMVLFVDENGYISGSGVMIDHHVILTSAQLFEGLGYNMYDFDLHYWRLFAGEYNVLTMDPHEKVYVIKSVVIHPGYNYTTLENDIALVITTQPIVWNDHTRPVCLPDNSTQAPVGSVCYLPGFGGMGGIQKTGSEEVMNQLNLPIVDDSICASHYKRYLPNTELCAGYENQHKNFCWDDLGGPLMFKANNGAWVVQGLASSGGNCTLANEPSVFEDVNMYTQWIRTTMDDAGFPYQY